ncbi:pyridoxamine 5'-phosphate oxidase [Podospora fimiseda]|uniref:Pyridoxamine 5'-phosphate oxidase n=1 Tax=Podospora fimiseda TaxID=252190 RepID=A0AAN7BVX0_9PEZI|nr:pyridoxamine 5'-phosphate oxidase [Podospora fimiseda]
MEQQIPLTHEPSLLPSHLTTTPSLPQQVISCLESARFLHLSTCSLSNIPHVSLMSYTYLPSSPFISTPLIIMTTNPSSKKFQNLSVNPNVSLLVHDWVSHRPANTSSQARRLSDSTQQQQHQSSLAALLFNLNTSAVSSISATINGHARLVERGTEEEKYYSDIHLANNTFEESAEGANLPSSNNDVRVIVVEIKDVRIADWKGNVRDWVITKPQEGGEATEDSRVNGV